MSRIEAEAHEALLRRRQSLSQHEHRHPADPEAHWHDYEASPQSIPPVVQQELEDIDAALARIREGRYGTCLACGGPMGLQRLKALPEARYCLACSGQAKRDDLPPGPSAGG